MATGRSTSSVNRTGRATSILSGRTRSRGGGSTSFSRSPWWARTTPEGIGLSSLNRRSANARDPRVRLADRPERDRGPSTGAERCSGHWRGEHIGRRDAPATRSFGSTHTTLRAGRGLPMGVTPEDLQGELDFIDLWGTDAYGRAFVDEQVALGNIVPADLATYMPRMTRGACTPDIARKMVQIWAEIDVRNVLEAVQTPTLLSYTRNGGRSSSSPSTSRPGCLRRRSRRMSGGGWNPEELPRGLSRSETSSV